MNSLRNILIVISVISFVLLLAGETYLNETAMDYETAVEKKNGAGSDFMNGYFTVVVQWDDGLNHGAYNIVYANDTKVLYFVYVSHSLKSKSYEIIPLYDENGEPQVYDEATDFGKDTGFYNSVVHAIGDLGVRKL